MKKSLLCLFLLAFVFSSYGQTKEEINSALNDFCKKIVFKNPVSFEIPVYAELAYLKRNFDLPYLKISDSAYISHLNDYYYRRFYLYSKLLNENAIVTEDCIHEEGNEQLNNGVKLLFYILYPNTIKLPADIVEQLEEYSTQDTFFSPVMILQDIYYLKQYNYQNLSKKQKQKLSDLEHSLSDRLYKNYVEGKPWGFYKVISIKVLRMNGNKLADDIDIRPFVMYFNENNPLEVSGPDISNTELLQTVGYRKVLQYEINALLWIFLTELKKI
jgi:hypothetical protein